MKEILKENKDGIEAIALYAIILLEIYSVIAIISYDSCGCIFPEQYIIANEIKSKMDIDDGYEIKFDSIFFYSSKGNDWWQFSFYLKEIENPTDTSNFGFIYYNQRTGKIIIDFCPKCQMHIHLDEN